MPTVPNVGMSATGQFVPQPNGQAAVTTMVFPFRRRTERSAILAVLIGVNKQEEDADTSCLVFKRIAGAVRRPRIVGSAALDICSVACGRCDGYFETGIYLWDIAAADLIVRQAGGRTCRVGKPLPHQRLAFVASNGRIHDDLVALVEGD